MLVHQMRCVQVAKHVPMAVVSTRRIRNHQRVAGVTAVKTGYQRLRNVGGQLHVERHQSTVQHSLPPKIARRAHLVIGPHRFTPILSVHGLICRLHTGYQQYHDRQNQQLLHGFFLKRYASRAYLPGPENIKNRKAKPYKKAISRSAKGSPPWTIKKATSMVKARKKEAAR